MMDCFSSGLMIDPFTHDFWRKTLTWFSDLQHYPTRVSQSSMAWLSHRCQSLPEQVPLVSFPKRTTISSVTRSFLTTVCKSTWSSIDQYWETSVKAGEHQRWETSVGLKVKIGGPATRVPRQWGKYIANPKNKEYLKSLKLTTFILNTNFLFRYRRFEAAIDICYV